MVENPAAFPCSPGDVPYWNEGMTLRDWFAGQALAALADSIVMGFAKTEPDKGDKYVNAKIALYSFQVADAMLAERSKP